MDLLNLLNPFGKGISSQNDPSAKDLRHITVFFYVFAVLSVIAVIWHCGLNRNSATPLLWGLACAAVGAAVGFLFGIPKILQSGATKTEPNEDRRLDYRQQVNTNLTEISDWLTKIIVGLGLINLRSIPDRLSSAALTLSTGLDPVDPTKHKAFAFALIVCYLIIGFLFGYLSTRLFLQAAFSRADQAAAAEAFVTDSRLQAIETKQEFILSSIETKQGGLPAEMVPHSDGGKEPVTHDGEHSTGSPSAPPPTKLPDALSQLRAAANRYLTITAPSLGERIRLKNQAANEMLNIIVTNKIPKDTIFSYAQIEKNEGMILALANCVLTFPQKGDVQLLLPLASIATRLHVRYRIVQAFGELFKTNCVIATDGPQVLAVLDAYEKEADQKLLSLIKGTRTRIDRILSQQQQA